jgi:3alpha(or 20beta)-hydroxysteroid dehydrogenase
MGKLDGRVAIVTGGARGQGLATAALFAQEGARVIITGRNAEAGEPAAASFGGAFMRQDVRSNADWSALVEAVVDRHGRLDILVNNAGLLVHGALLDMSVSDYMRVVDVNQVGIFLGMQAVARPMMRARSGSIVNISSVAGLRGAQNPAYCASKWAVCGMTKSAATELAPYNIRVNCVCSGMIESDMLKTALAGDPEFIAKRIGRVSMKRPGKAEEVARMNLFLASDDSSYSTGAEFVLDGGMMAS